MLSTIIEQGSTESRANFIHSLLSPQINLLHVQAETSSIGIKQIRELLSLLSNTSPIKRLVWIEEASLLTPDAGNALLKSLEEPPHNTQFYLSCASAKTLLPTIRSRCQVLQLHLADDTSLVTKTLPTIKQAMAATAGDRLALSQTLVGDRSTTLQTLASLAQEIHTTIDQTSSPAGRLLLGKLAGLTLTAHTQVLSNVSPALALGNLFLHLPKTK